MNTIQPMSMQNSMNHYSLNRLAKNANSVSFYGTKNSLKYVSKAYVKTRGAIVNTLLVLMYPLVVLLDSLCSGKPKNKKEQ